MDTFKALALGATAVCVGKWLMGPLQENGAEGVKDEIIKMTQESGRVMARTGFETSDKIETVHPKNPKMTRGRFCLCNNRL